MKPRNFILAAVGIVAVALGVLLAIGFRKHNEKQASIRHIPDITINTIEGDTFSLSETRPGRKTAILFFSTDCEFCRKEIEGIIAAKEMHDGIEWVFVTISPLDDLESFLIDYPLESIPGAKVCREDYPELHITMNVTAPPSLFIYDADGDIEHYKRGAVSIKTILEWLK